jgi:hypothetical protein
VLAHARALLTSTPEGATAYLDSDLRETGKVLDAAGQVLDFSEPVAVMLIGVLHCIPDDEDPRGIVKRLMAAVPPRSYRPVPAVAPRPGRGSGRADTRLVRRRHQAGVIPTAAATPGYDLISRTRPSRGRVPACGSELFPMFDLSWTC